MAGRYRTRRCAAWIQGVSSRDSFVIHFGFLRHFPPMLESRFTNIASNIGKKWHQKSIVAVKRLS
jgi:hypothetical protein